MLFLLVLYFRNKASSFLYEDKMRMIHLLLNSVKPPSSSILASTDMKKYEKMLDILKVVMKLVAFTYRSVREKINYFNLFVEHSYDAVTSFATDREFADDTDVITEGWHKKEHH